MWMIHADVLKMANTKEKRDAIKWFYARSVFFGAFRSFADGLALARQSENADARFLVALFAGEAPCTSDEVLAVLGRKRASRDVFAGRQSWQRDP